MDRLSLEELLKSLQGDAFSLVKESLYAQQVENGREDLGTVLEKVAGDERFARLLEAARKATSANGNGKCQAPVPDTLSEGGCEGLEEGIQHAPPMPVSPDAPFDLEVALESTLAAHVQLCGAVGGRLSLHSSTSGDMSGAPVGDGPAAAALPSDQYSSGHGFARTISTWNAYANSSDTGPSALVEDFDGLTEALGISTVVNTPVVSRNNHPLGMLSFHFRHCHPPSALDTGIVGLCAFHVADLLEAARCQDKLQEIQQDCEFHIQQGKTQLRTLVLELATAEQRERRRLAQQMHDQLQQLLVAAKMQASFASEGYADAGTPNRILEILDEAILCCRAIVAGLSPPILHGVNLPDTLKWLARDMRRQHGLSVSVFVEEGLAPGSDSLRLLLMEIARELLFNCVKHSGRKEASVRAACEQDLLLLEVADEGVGCEPGALEKAFSDSLGLTSIRERVTALGGSMHTWSAPHKGCKVWVRVPNCGNANTARSSAVSSV